MAKGTVNIEKSNHATAKKKTLSKSLDQSSPSESDDRWARSTIFGILFTRDVPRALELEDVSTMLCLTTTQVNCNFLPPPELGKR